MKYVHNNQYFIFCNGAIFKVKNEKPTTSLNGFQCLFIVIHLRGWLYNHVRAYLFCILYNLVVFWAFKKIMYVATYHHLCIHLAIMYKQCKKCKIILKWIRREEIISFCSASYRYLPRDGCPHQSLQSMGTVLGSRNTWSCIELLKVVPSS